MSIFNDPRYIEHPLRQSKRAPVIDGDRLCKRCGYNLKGLEINAVCPECGEPIRFAGLKEDEETLADAPLWRIKLLGVGFASLLMGAILAVAVYARFRAAGTPAGLLGFVGSGFWLLGAAVVSMPRPSTKKVERDGSEWRWLRLAAWVSQAAWPMLTTTAIAGGFKKLSALSAGMMIDAGAVAVWGLWAIGGFGLLPLLWLIARLSVWMNDHARGDRLRMVAVWSMIVLVLNTATTYLPSASTTLEFLLLLIVQAVFGGLMLVGVVYTFLSLGQLTATCWWAVGTVRHEAERQEQLMERLRREDAAQQARRLKEGFGGPVAPPLNNMMGISKAPPMARPRPSDHRPFG